MVQARKEVSGPVEIFQARLCWPAGFTEFRQLASLSSRNPQKSTINNYQLLGNKGLQTDQVHRSMLGRYFLGRSLDKARIIQTAGRS